MKNKLKHSKLRNPFHDHPLMKKGGVHEKSEKSKRHVMKQKLKQGEWYEQSVCRIFCSCLLSVNS